MELALVEKQLRLAEEDLTVVPCPGNTGIRLKLVSDYDHDRLSAAVMRGPHENTTAMWAKAYQGGRVMAAYIAANSKQFAGSTVLDIGCGGGIAALAAAKAGATVIAVDSNPFAVMMVTANANLNSLNVEAVQADFMENDPEFIKQYNRADIVIAADAICPYHVEGADIASRNMAGMLKTGYRIGEFARDGKIVFYASQNVMYQHIFSPRYFAIRNLDPFRRNAISFAKVAALPKNLRVWPLLAKVSYRWCMQPHI